MNISEDKVLLCPICEYEYNHLIGTITVKDNDAYIAEKFIITLYGKTYEINSNVKYPFRSQGNTHLLFQCESGHYHIVSFDGHKGRMFVGENSLLDKLSLYLNDALLGLQGEENIMYQSLSTFKILSLIEEFLEQFTE